MTRVMKIRAREENGKLYKAEPESLGMFVDDEIGIKFFNAVKIGQGSFYLVLEKQNKYGQWEPKQTWFKE